LGLYTGINPCNLVFLIGPRGRPRLASDQAADLDFNLARRDDCFVIALGLGRRIVIDIESCRSSELVETTMIMFEDEDRTAIERTEGLNRHKRLIEAWTALEASAKAIGTGIGESVSYNRMVTCKNFELGCEWIGCVAAEGLNWQIKLISERRLQEQTALR
jgi:phosphopantetheinyl transferase